MAEPIFITTTTLRKSLRSERADWTQSKREAKRYSAGWHKSDGAQAALDAILDELKYLEAAAKESA